MASKEIDMDRRAFRTTTTVTAGLILGIFDCGGTSSPSGATDAAVGDVDVEAGAHADGGLSDADLDVAYDGHSDACAPCQTTLDQACTTDGGLDCPPDLGSAGFFDWAQQQIGNHPGGGSWLDPSCFSYTACPDMVIVWFGVAKDG
ncbi:MAG: hypothetical protein ACRENE_16785, partial [Polyangiaceae bacterium]